MKRNRSKTDANNTIKNSKRKQNMSNRLTTKPKMSQYDLKPTFESAWKAYNAVWDAVPVDESLDKILARLGQSITAERLRSFSNRHSAPLPHYCYSYRERMRMTAVPDIYGVGARA